MATQAPCAKRPRNDKVSAKGIEANERSHRRQSCNALTTVSIPGVKSIGVCAFEGCSSLKTVNVSTSLVDIGGEAFANCKLLAIDIPEALIKYWH